NVMLKAARWAAFRLSKKAQSAKVSKQRQPSFSFNRKKQIQLKIEVIQKKAPDFSGFQAFRPFKPCRTFVRRRP
ncbi:MAG: hypothetical protein IKL24_02630, partial [Clostridia bacterium]|nr:hypothetical protein [Clostridia bacterium]